MSTKVFDIQEVFQGGWDNFKKAPVLLIALMGLAAAASILTNILFSFLPPLILSLLNSIATSYFMLSLARAVILLGKGETPDWSVLKNDLNLFVKFVVVSLILSVLFLISAILLIFPLVIALSIFFPVPYLVVMRQDLSIIDIFKKSWEMTTPNFISCLIFIFVVFLLAFAGMLLLLVGLLVAVPVIYAAGAIVCDKLGAGSSPVKPEVSSVSAQ